MDKKKNQIQVLQNNNNINNNNNDKLNNEEENDDIDNYDTNTCNLN